MRSTRYSQDIVKHVTFHNIQTHLSLVCILSLTTTLPQIESCLQAADNAVTRQQQRIETIERISPSVVCVMPPDGQGGGSGVLISPDGYAISNYHVTSGSGNFMKCGLNDGKVYDAVIVGIDPTGDVALIRLLGRDDFPFCTPGDSDRVKTGDEVLALGNPFLLASDFSPTVTFGIVSGVHRYQYPANSFLEYTDCIQIDASINPGNSGGPLFDINGQWIGINGRASFEKRGRINTGAAYAISVRQVLLFVDHLKSGSIVDHGRTDFTVGTYDQTVQIEQVSNLSEAWRRGMRPGNEIISFAGRSLTSANDFKNILGIFPAGSRVPIVFRNDDGVQKITVRLSGLHDFEDAPQLPEEQQPEHRPKPSDPDAPEDKESEEHHHAEEMAVVPEQYSHLFVEKKGFANFYFNQINTNRFLEPLKKTLPPASPAAWVLKVAATTDDGQHVGELSVSPKGAGLDLAGLAPELQPAGNQDPSNECPQLFGLLSGLLQWNKLFQDYTKQFSDVHYVGAETLLPSGTSVHTILTTDGAITSRWYFNTKSPLPVGVDVHLSAGADEGRLRFADWKTDGETPMPQRIGVVDSNTETIHWITIDAMTITPGAGKTAATQAKKSEVAS